MKEGKKWQHFNNIVTYGCHFYDTKRICGLVHFFNKASNVKAKDLTLKAKAKNFDLRANITVITTQLVDLIRPSRQQSQHEIADSLVYIKA
jgi:hypothetical protein